MAVLHPPDGGPDEPITLPLLPLNTVASFRGETAGSMGTFEVDNKSSSVNISGINSPLDTKNNHPTVRTTSRTKSQTDLDGSDTRQTSAQQSQQPHHGGAAGRFTSRMMTTVQKGLAKGGAITGTLTVSLQIFDNDEEDFMTNASSGEPGGRRGAASGGGVKNKITREPPAPREPTGYAAIKFKIAEDAAASKRRREREGIKVPRMLARVQALHDRLDGDDAKKTFYTAEMFVIWVLEQQHNRKLYARKPVFMLRTIFRLCEFFYDHAEV